MFFSLPVVMANNTFAYHRDMHNFVLLITSLWLLLCVLLRIISDAKLSEINMPLKFYF